MLSHILVLSIFITLVVCSASFAQSADVNATDVGGNVSADVENQINSFPTCDPTNTLCHIFGIDLKIKLDQFTNAIGVTPPETVAEDQIIANYEREKELVQLQNMEQAGNISAAAAQSTYDSLQSDIQNDNQSLNSEIAVIQQANPQEDVGALQNVQTVEQSTDIQINTDQSQIVTEQTVSTSSETTSEQSPSPTVTETQTNNTESPTETATSSTFSGNATVNETASQPNETSSSTGNISVETNNSSVSGLVGIVQSVENITGDIVSSIDNTTVGIIQSIENITQTTTETATQTTTEVTVATDNSPTDSGVAISGEVALVQVKNLTTVGPVVKNKNSRLEQFQAAMQKKMADLNASKSATKPSIALSNKPAAPKTKPSTPSINRK